MIDLGERILVKLNFITRTVIDIKYPAPDQEERRGDAWPRF